MTNQRRTSPMLPPLLIGVAVVVVLGLVGLVDADAAESTSPAGATCPSVVTTTDALAEEETWAGMFLRSLKMSFENQFIGGSLVLTITGGIMALLYNLYSELSVLANNRLYITVEVTRSQEIYHWLTHWLINHEVVQRSSHFSATTRIGPADDEYYEPSMSRRTLANISFIPVGTKTTYKVLYRQTIVWITFENEGELTNQRGMFFGGGIGYPSAPPDRHGYILRTLNVNGNGRMVITQLINDAQTEYNRRSEHSVEMFLARYGQWERIGSRLRRKMNSVILDGDAGERLLNDARQFLSEGSWYSAHGIPHRRGYLLYGPPGCGKTSFITALAGELQLPLCMISLSEPSIDGYTFTRLMNTAPESAIIVLEDVDAAFVSRSKTAIGTATPDSAMEQDSTGMANTGTGSTMAAMEPEDPFPAGWTTPHARNNNSGSLQDQRGPKLSFSDLLNGLDGLAAQEGRILFLTTNHLAKLDPALIRPGRIDLQLEFPLACSEQAQRLFRHFYDNICSSEISAGSNETSDKPARSMHHESPEQIAIMASQFAAAIPSRKYSMATLQGYLMQYRRAPNEALANMASLLGQQNM